MNCELHYHVYPFWGWRVAQRLLGLNIERSHLNFPQIWTKSRKGWETWREVQRRGQGRWRGRHKVGLYFYLLLKFHTWLWDTPNQNSFHSSLTFQSLYLFYCKYSSRRKINRQEKKCFIQYTQSDRKYRMERTANSQQIKSGDKPRTRTSWLQIHSPAWVQCSDGHSSSEQLSGAVSLIFIPTMKETEFINDAWAHLFH